MKPSTRLLALLAPILLMSFLVACGGDDDDDDSGEPPTGVTRAATSAQDEDETPTSAASPTEAAESPTTAGTSTAAAGTTTPSAGGDGEGTELEISADNEEFDKDELRAAAGQPVTIVFTNNEDLPHNVSVYETEEAEEEIFVGDLITGPDETIDYEFDAPSEPGTYFFHCDVHPTTMTGDFIVE